MISVISSCNSFITFVSSLCKYVCLFLLANTLLMLYTIAVILIVLWLLGFGFRIGGDLIHILLVLAIVSVLLRVIQGKKPL